jgi:uncharacterized protein
VSIILTIDTNIWAYFFDRDSPEHKNVAKAVEKALKTEKIAINTVIIMELAHYLVKNLGPVNGSEKLSSFLSYPFVVLDLNYASTLEAVEMLKRYSHLGIGGRDATILALMKEIGTKKIMTHDEALKKVDWVEAVDPAANTPGKNPNRFS